MPLIFRLLSLRFNGHFLGEPGLAGADWSKGRWQWWWQLELQVMQSSSQIITTNKPTPIFRLLFKYLCECKQTNHSRTNPWQFEPNVPSLRD